ncbi:ABC transporter substrate-binding protein [Catelliglobosispora koreensis]|uniref:ABC transporter substrate-binding protein n=1 Tax=Catelliglobosispora koreensis TaxID=129052 RepID=UPI00036B094E|nr:ABC transporter substrate-binding protein [Catelliglobosispora koreensis]
MIRPHISRRHALTGGIGLAAGGLLAACSTPTGTPAAPAPKVTAQAGVNELVVGANLELTGTGSTFGKLQEQALLIAAAEINSTGLQFGDRRIPVRLVIKDNGGVPASASQVTQQLIDKEKVSAIIGGTTVETGLSMLAVAEQRKVPLLCLASGDDISVPLPQRKFIYKLGPNSSDVATVLAREIRRLALPSVALLASPDGHGEGGTKALPRALAAAGITHTTTVRLPQATHSFADAAKQINASKAKAVVIWAQAPVSAAAVAAVRAAGYTGKIFLDPGAGADETLTGENSGAVDGTYIVHPTVLSGAPLTATTPSGRAARDFIFRYIQQYGTYSGFAPYAADALNLVAFAAKRAAHVDPQRLRGRLEAGAVEGIAGAYAFQPISHGGLEPDALVLFVARQGAWIRL